MAHKFPGVGTQSRGMKWVDGKLCKVVKPKSKGLFTPRIAPVVKPVSKPTKPAKPISPWDALPPDVAYEHIAKLTRIQLRALGLLDSRNNLIKRP